MNLLRDLLGECGGFARREGASRFMASVAASNHNLIPVHIALECNLGKIASQRDSDIIARECRRKTGLLDGDRRIDSCTFHLGTLGDRTFETRLAAIPLLRDACASFVANDVPVTAQVDFGARVMPSLQRCPAHAGSEVFIVASLDTNSEGMQSAIANLSAAIHDPDYPPVHAVLWLTLSETGHSTAWIAAKAQALLERIAAPISAIYLMPLVAGMRTGRMAGHDPLRQAAFAGLTEVAAACGFLRTAPGFYLAKNLSSTPRHAAIPRHLAQLAADHDVLGLGPAMTSDFDDTRFRNHSHPADYAAMVEGDGLGIEAVATTSRSERFYTAFLATLASGEPIDPAAFAEHHHQTNPGCVAALKRTVDRLVEHDFLMRTLDGRVAVGQPNDGQFARVIEAVRANDPLPDPGRMHLIHSR